MIFAVPTDDNPLGLIPESKEDIILLLELALEEMENINRLLQEIFPL